MIHDAMNRFRGPAVFIVLATLGFAVSAAAQTQLPLQRFEFDRPAMGVKFAFVLYASGHEEAACAMVKAAERLVELESIFSDYQSDSEAMKLVAAPTGQPIHTTPDLWRLMSVSQKLSQESDGAFDITIGPVTQLWRLARKRNRLPDQEAIQTAMKSVGSNGFEMVQPSQVIIKRIGMRLDFGGIAKGFAADECLEIFRQRGIDSALVDASGDIALGSAPPGESGWWVAVADLNNLEAIGQTLCLSNCGVATSSDGRQALRQDGVRHSHIIDPRSGQALVDHSCVTVIANSATAADGWASALSVLGPHRAIELADCRGDIHVRVALQPQPNQPVSEFQSRDFQKFFAK